VIAVPRRRSRAARSRAGFTLVELMISLLISAILVGMILSIFTRMSTAYRTQQHVAELQQVLVSGQELIQRDLRQAGFAMPDGFQKSGFALNTYHAPIKIVDNGSGFGPDEIYIYYGDPSAQARVVSFTSSTELVVDAVDRFGPTDLVVIANHEMVDTPEDLSGSPPYPPVKSVARYRTCVGKLTSITGTTFRLITTGDWGQAGSRQCDFVRDVHGTAAGETTMIYRLAARGYRIDPTRRSLAVLQVSPTGGIVAGDWQDLGVGFTDLQVASRWHEGEADSADWSGANPKYVDTPDLDTDVQRDWYSGPSQTLQTDAEVGNSTPGRNRPLMTEVRVTLVVRTTGKIDTVGTGKTPTLTDAARPNNNDVGNRAAVTLAGVADASRPEELRGDHIYRYATVGSDLRNMAVAR
jgi:prepilin-type N-terminal cleavage/methylation domain-containing protein